MTFRKDGLCSACQIGKQAKTSFKSKVRHSSTRPLQLLHMDLFESSVVNYAGQKYGLVVVNDYSIFTWVIFLKHKSETKVEIPSLLNKLEVMKNDKVSIIRTDHGIEFVNQYIKEFCTCKGIQHQLSSVRTPQQNGIVERKNRTLKEAARTMLPDTRISEIYWVEAVYTACYTQNRCLINKFHDKTPYELLVGRPPVITHLRVFGCKCFVLNNGKEYLRTFQPKVDEGIFLGYSLNSKAYRLFNKRTQKIEESVHVVFHETKQTEVAENNLHKQFKELMIKVSEEQTPSGGKPIVTLEDDSDDEKPSERHSNNQMTLKHDEEFPAKNSEMNSPLDIQQPSNDNVVEEIAERQTCDHHPNSESSNTEQVSDETMNNHLDNIDPQNPKNPRKWIKDHPAKDVIGSINDELELGESLLNKQTLSMDALFLK